MDPEPQVVEDTYEEHEPNFSDDDGCDEAPLSQDRNVLLSAERPSATVALGASAVVPAVDPAEASGAPLADESDDAASPEISSEDLWRTRQKHVFVLTSAGKPVFSRYGDESDFSELFGILQVLISMAATSGPSGSAPEVLRRVTAGSDFSIHFHTVEELSYVMVTRTGESAKACVRQLRMLHHQMLSTIPTVNNVLKKSPGYDVRRIFSHADANVMRQLIKHMSWDPVFMFRAIKVIPVVADLRRDVHRVVSDARLSDDHLYSLLLFRGAIVASLSPKGHALHIDDLLILLNFVSCVLKTQRGEIWAPLCLPKFNDSGYMWCYCARLRHGEDDTASSAARESDPRQQQQDDGLVMVHLATSQDAFPDLSSSASTIHDVLAQRGLLQELEAVCRAHENVSLKWLGFDAASTSCSAVQWFAAMTDAKTLVTSSMPPPLAFSKTRRKAFLRTFAKLRDRLTILSRAPNPLMIHCTDEASLVVLRQKTTEVLVSFLPCTERKEMVDVAMRLVKLVAAKDPLISSAKSFF